MGDKISIYESNINMIRKLIGIKIILSLSGEIAITSDKFGKHKVGDGTHKWSELSYAKAELTKGDVTGALGYTPPSSDTWRGIQDNLISSSTTESLSAAQGKY